MMMMMMMMMMKLLQVGPLADVVASTDTETADVIESSTSQI